MPYVTTAKTPGGLFYGVAWTDNNKLIAMSEPLPTRGQARSWAQRKAKRMQHDA